MRERLRWRRESPHPDPLPTGEGERRIEPTAKWRRLEEGMRRSPREGEAGLAPLQVPHELGELRDALLGLGGFGVPALFGLEAQPAVVADFAKHVKALADRQLAFAKQARAIFPIDADRILDVNVPDVSSISLMPLRSKKA